MRQKMIRLRSVLLVAVLLAALAPAARAQALLPGSITAIDARTGIVSAKVSASGAAFQFRVTDPKLLVGLHMGQGVYANFTTKQVSLDGKRMCCEITSAPQAPAPLAAPVTAPKPVSPSPASAAVAKPATGSPCCSITAINIYTGVVTAKENATGRIITFQIAHFQPVDGAKLFQTFRVGSKLDFQPVDGAALTSGSNVSLMVLGFQPVDGIVASIGTAATSTTPASPVAVPSRTVAQIKPLPTMSYGTPHPITLQEAPVLGLRGPRSQQRSIGGVTVAHVRGVDGLEQVQGIPEGVKNLLAIHVRTLPAGESDHYVINVAQAQEWIKTHPIPSDVKPTDVKTGDGHSGCHVVSWHCAEESAKHAEDEASRQADMIRTQAQADWKHWSTELTKDWHEVVGCLEDNTLHLDNIPVQFSITPQMNINAQTQGKTKDGSASGSITGTLGLGTQVDSNLQASLDVFYIPCLPFVVRPKAMGAVGTLGVTPKLTASLNANGKFDKTFDIPPTGDPHIPIQAIPIVIAGVPVAELDISVHFEGNIEVGGQGQLTASFEVDDPHQFAIDFICSGHSCGKGPGKDPMVNQVPPTTTETYKLAGNAFVQPDIYVALEMNFDYDAATVRIGPQPYLRAQVYGCGTATQTTTTTTTTTESHALVSDLDWGMILRTEFWVGGTKEGKGWNPVLVGNRHLWFKDLWPGGSNALIPTITGPTQADAGKTTVYNIKMPACYPFADQVKYSVAWTGGKTTGASNTAPTRVAVSVATASLSRTNTGEASSSASSPCSLPAGCQSDPLKNYALNLVWPTAGTYALTVTATGDTPHHREFKPPPTATADVTVK